MQNRILAKVLPNERVAHRRGAWVWAFGAATGAVILVAVVTFFSHRKPAPIPAPQVVSYPAPLQIGPAPVAVQPTLRRHTPRLTAAARRPEQFPTPAPLSEEERLLLAYVASTPSSELSTPIVRDPQIEPLQFSEIKIARIEIKELPRLNE
ncbi:MAG: hypothetical protein ABSG54_13025 [Terriglobia bacterium]